MKSGYDQFFKQAQKASLGAAPAAAQKRREKSPRPPVKPSQKSKGPSKAPWGFLVVCGFGLFAAIAGFLHVEEVDRFLSRVEIQFLGQASAQQAPASAPAASAPEAASSSTPAAANSVVTSETTSLDHLLKIKEKSRELQLKEEELARTEAELEAQKLALEKRIEELNNLRRDISSVLENKVKIDEQKVDTLVQVYTNMKPVQAAKVIETLDEDLAVEILNRMKKKNAADIMNMLKPEKAQIFTEKLAGFKR